MEFCLTELEEAFREKCCFLPQCWKIFEGLRDSETMRTVIDASGLSIAGT